MQMKFRGINNDGASLPFPSCFLATILLLFCSPFPLLGSGSLFVDSLMGMDCDFTDDARVFPPGFRFHPTDEELVGYYLKRKICRKRHHMDVIGETDVYKCDPEELPAMSKLRNGDRQWFFFSPRDRKYPNGARSNRATSHGYWKATGKDRIISCGSRAAGIKKTLVFYRGRARRGERTDWVMHEYTMDEEELKRYATVKEYYALYKVFKKSGPGPKNGEQYGAPFREEDWDNEDLEVESFIVGENPVTKSADDTVALNEIMPANGQYMSSLDDLMEFMNKLENEPVTILQSDNDGNTLDKPVAEEANLVEHSASDVPASNLRQTGMMHSNLPETAEVSSAPVLNVLDTGLTEEEIFGDFLEMDDLLGPCPATHNPAQRSGELLLDDLDGLNEYDLLQDSIFCDGGINDYDIRMMTHQMQQQFTNVSSYTEVQSYSAHTVESGQEAIPSSHPGFIQTSDHLNHHPTTGSGDNKINQQDDGNDSWLTSVIWSYMESIPTTPASASEGAFVNRVPGSKTLPSSGKCRINWLMFLVPLIGVFCAVIWTFVGTPGRLI